MRLIDADALKRRCQKVATEAWKMKMTASVETVMNQFIDFIEEAPTVSATPRVLTWEELIDVTDPVWYEERDGLSSWALCADVTCGNAYEDMSYEFFENYDNSYIREYADKCNVYWRCWSAKPTEEQRKAVKWDD